MNESALYLLRLTEVCLAAFFVLHQGIALIVLTVSPVIIGFARRLRASEGAQLLFAFRVLPVALSSAIVLALCIPSYFRFEHDARESISLGCLIAALFGFTVIGISVERVFRAALLSRRLRKNPSDCIAFALVGFFRSHIFVSPEVQRALTSTQMEVAIRHEAAHSSAYDNLKRLAIIASPSLLPFAPFHKTLESEWARLAECAADECAVADEPRRAIDLADALLRVARLSSSTKTIHSISTLVASEKDLADRINRLLNLSHQEFRSGHTLRHPPLFMSALLVLSLVPFSPTAQYAIHTAMERFVH
jgi:hypothetical protein